MSPRQTRSGEPTERGGEPARIPDDDGRGRVQGTQERATGEQDQPPTEDEGTHRDGDRVDWAQERTDWAHGRTLLAKERTFSAWLRTGLAVLIAGFAVGRFLQMEDGVLIRIASLTLVVVGGVVIVLGYWSYRRGMQELEAEGVRGVPRLVLISIVVALVIATFLGGLAVL